jgi:integrase
MADAFLPERAAPFPEIPEDVEPEAVRRNRAASGLAPEGETTRSGFGDVAHVEGLARKAQDYARGARATNTNRAYAADWRHFTGWCVKTGLAPLPANPQVIGVYISALATLAGVASKAGSSVATIERRVAGLLWNYRQRGQSLDRTDPHIREVLAGIRRKHGRPPTQKEPVLGDDLPRLLETLGRDLRGLRDRAILLVGFAGGLRRSEIVGLDHGEAQTDEGSGWVEILEGGALLHIKGKTGWRDVEIGRGSNDLTCPVAALELWIRLARIEHGPIFRRVSRDGQRALIHRLNDRHVAKLVQRTAGAAGLRGDLLEAERRLCFGGHSLRAGLASSAEVDERHVQRQLGHASAEMTRRYQRRKDRFRVNLTKSAGL